jgi:LacI family transcriptional regulator
VVPADGTAKSATLRDVARVAGVDRSVVSRVINDDPGLSIRAETRTRIQAAVRQVGYVPNIAARSLRKAESGTLGLVIPDYANPVYAEIIAGAEARARESRHVLLTGSVRQQGGSVEEFVTTLGGGRVDALLLAGVRLDRPAVAVLERSGTPWLLLNSQQESIPWTVSLDDRWAAALGLGHLAELGHRRIAHLQGPARSDTARRRRDGYQQALEAHGLEFDPALLVRGDYTASGGRLAMQELLESGVEFSGVLAANVASALGAIHEAARQGVRVPAQVSVVCVNDLDLADYVQPSLTTVRMPLFELGRRGADLLLNADGRPPVHVVIREPIELVWRGSTGPPPETGFPRPAPPTPARNAPQKGTRK